MCGAKTTQLITTPIGEAWWRQHHAMGPSGLGSDSCYLSLGDGCHQLHLTLESTCRFYFLHSRIHTFFLLLLSIILGYNNRFIVLTNLLSTKSFVFTKCFILVRVWRLTREPREQGRNRPRMSCQSFAEHTLIHSHTYSHLGVMECHQSSCLWELGEPGGNLYGYAENTGNSRQIIT